VYLGGQAAGLDVDAGLSAEQVVEQVVAEAVATLRRLSAGLA
jgi:hypothetical protein